MDIPVTEKIVVMPAWDELLKCFELSPAAQANKLFRTFQPMLSTFAGERVPFSTIIDTLNCGLQNILRGDTFSYDRLTELETYAKAWLTAIMDTHTNFNPMEKIYAETLIYIAPIPMEDAIEQIVEWLHGLQIVVPRPAFTWNYEWFERARLIVQADRYNPLSRMTTVIFQILVWDRATSRFRCLNRFPQFKEDKSSYRVTLFQKSGNEETLILGEGDATDLCVFPNTPRGSNYSFRLDRTE